MKLSINKICTALVIGMSTISAGAYAARGGNYGDGDCCDFQFGCGEWSAGVSALYWTAKEDGLAYGAKLSEEPVDATTPSLVSFEDDVKYKNFDFDWNIGYRVNIDYLTTSQINFGLEYTHFNTRAKGHGNSEGTLGDGGELFFPTYVTSNDFVIDADTGTGFDGHVKLDIDYIDATVGREFQCVKCATVTPFVGARFARVDQKYHSVSTSTNFAGLTETDTETLTMNNQFDGAGLRGGLATKWNLGNSVSFFGLAAISALWGEHKVTYDDTITGIGGGLGATTTLLNDSHQKDTYQAFRGITDLAVGFTYDWEFCDSNVLEVSLAWEHHLFFNMNRFEENGLQNNLTAAQHSRGDLGTSGVTVGLNYAF